MQLRENIEDLQDENRKLIRETFDFINKIQIFEYFLKMNGLRKARMVVLNKYFLKVSESSKNMSRQKYDKYHIFPRLTASFPIVKHKTYIVVEGFFYVTK